MFNGSRYTTQGIQAQIPEYIQNLLWYMVDIMEITEKDYLQVFDLSSVIKKGKLKQRIIHKQEHPCYINENIISVNNPIFSKIYVIDDTTHCTMLLAEEY